MTRYSSSASRIAYGRGRLIARQSTVEALGEDESRMTFSSSAPRPSGPLAVIPPPRGGPQGIGLPDSAGACRIRQGARRRERRGGDGRTRPLARLLRRRTISGTARRNSTRIRRLTVEKE